MPGFRIAIPSCNRQDSSPTVSIVAFQDWSSVLRCKLIITLMPPKMRSSNTKTATKNAPKNMCSTGRGVFLRLLLSNKSTSLPNFLSWLGTYRTSCQCSKISKDIISANSEEIYSRIWRRTAHHPQRDELDLWHHCRESFWKTSKRSVNSKGIVGQ